jgi:hypothetical protein
MSAPVSAGRHNLLASPDPGELGDHHRDPRQGSQVGVELISPGALQQGLLDLGELGGRQLGIGGRRPDCAGRSTPICSERACQTWTLWWDTPSSLATSAWVRPGRTARRRAAVGPHGWHAHLGDWGGGWSTSPDPHTASTRPSTHLPDVVVGCGVAVPGLGWASGAGLAGFWRTSRMVVLAWMFWNPWRTRAGVRRPGAAGRSQGG